MSKHFIYAYAVDPTFGDKNTRLDFDGPTEYNTSVWGDMKEEGRYSRVGARWSMPHMATFEDGTRRMVRIRPAPCGGGCYCAAEWREA